MLQGSEWQVFSPKTEEEEGDDGVDGEGGVALGGDSEDMMVSFVLFRVALWWQC